jgi:ABC-type Fe3+-siderophore transport system permease subunit
MAGSKILFVSGTVGVVASVATHTDHPALVLFGCGLLGLCLLVLIIIAGVLFVPQDYPADRLLNLLNLLRTIQQPRTPRRAADGR